MALLQSVLTGLYDYAMQDRPDLQQLQSQGGQITPPSSMDPLTQSMMNSQAMQAQAGLPQAGYSPQMSMGQAPNQSPINPAGTPEVKGLLESIGNRMEQYYGAPRRPQMLSNNFPGMTPPGTGMMNVGPATGSGGSGMGDLIKMMMMGG